MGARVNRIMKSTPLAETSLVHSSRRSREAGGPLPRAREVFHGRRQTPGRWRTLSGPAAAPGPADALPDAAAGPRRCRRQADRPPAPPGRRGRAHGQKTGPSPSSQQQLSYRFIEAFLDLWQQTIAQSEPLGGMQSTFAAAVLHLHAARRAFAGADAQLLAA